MKFSAKNVAYLAMLLAIQILLKSVLNFKIAGTGISFGLTYIPPFVAGFYFGPVGGGIVGLIGDILGSILAGKGDPIPLMMLGNAMMGVIPGLVRYIKLKNKRILVVISFLLTYVVTSMWINTFALWQVYFDSEKGTFWPYFTTRMITSLPNMLMNMIVSLLMFPLFNRLFLPKIGKSKSQSEEKTKGETGEDQSTENTSSNVAIADAKIYEDHSLEKSSSECSLLEK